MPMPCQESKECVRCRKEKKLRKLGMVGVGLLGSGI